MVRLRFLLTIAVAAAAKGQATPSVPPSAQIYRDIARLGALGLIDTLLVGSKPYSEREITRLLGEAQTNLSRNPAAAEWATRIIQTDLARYGAHVNRPFDAASVEATMLDSPFSAAPSDQNGTIDAAINPLAANRSGRPLADGNTLALASIHSATIGPWIAASISPRLSLLDARGGNSSALFALQSGEINALIAGLSIEAGRTYAAFGPSPTGGLLLSPGGPPLDMVRISNDRPWRVPLFSRVFGPVYGSLLVADLGTRTIHPHSKLAAYHLAMLPHPQFELGVEVIDAMGGRGGQAASFGDRVLDAIPVIDALRTGSDFQFSNKMAGVDFHWRMPRWSGFELYLEAGFDDVDSRRWRSVFLEDGGYLAGISVSCLFSCGAFAIRAEYHQTGIRYYTQLDYPIAVRGQLLGDPLGPRGNGAYLTVDDDRGKGGRLSLQGAFEIRSGNTYGSQATGPTSAGFHFVQIARRPGEKRWRGMASWTASELTRVAPSLSVGLERTSNFNFVDGANRTNAIAQLGLIVWP